MGIDHLKRSFTRSIFFVQLAFAASVFFVLQFPSPSSSSLSSSSSAFAANAMAVADVPSKLLSSFIKAEVPDASDEVLSPSATHGSVIIGPPVINSLLLMVREGAAGETAEEIDGYLGSTESNSSTSLDAVQQLLPPPAGSITEAIVDFGLAVFPDSSIEKDPVFEEYKSSTQKKFDATVKTVDYVGDRSGAVEKINSFIREKTHDRISSIFSEGDVTDETLLVLASAIFFKGTWFFPFETEMTQPAEFSTIRTVDGKDGVVKVPGVQFMNLYQQVMSRDRPIHLHHDQQAGVHTLELPYRAAGLSMVFFWLDDPTSFSSFTQQKLKESPGLLNKLVNAGRKAKDERRPFHLSLPKFRIESLEVTDLKPTMQDLGIKKMFTSRAEFPKISKEKNLMVSKFVTKAIIEVSEKGTVAAAAAGMMMMATSLPPPPRKATIDSPFVFQIRYHPHQGQDQNQPLGDAESDVVLFEGQVINPLPLQKEFKENDW